MNAGEDSKKSEYSKVEPMTFQLQVRKYFSGGDSGKFGKKPDCAKGVEFTTLRLY